MNPDENKIRQRLLKHKLRPTRARIQILLILGEKASHMTTEDIIKELKGREIKIGAATVYQNLVRLVEVRLLDRFLDSDGLLRYDINLNPHHHMICVRCGKVVDLGIKEHILAGLPNDSLEIESPFKGWAVESIQMEFRGVCPDCHKK